MPNGERFEPPVSAPDDAASSDAESAPAEVIDPARATEDTTADATGLRALVDRSRDRIAAEQARLSELIDKYHDRPLLDICLRIYQRDRDAAGAVVGSALAFRLFLFFVPLTLFVVGILGFLGRWFEPRDINEAAGLGGTVAAQISTAMSQPTSARWFGPFA